MGAVSTLFCGGGDWWELFEAQEAINKRAPAENTTAVCCQLNPLREVVLTPFSPSQRGASFIGSYRFSILTSGVFAIYVPQTSRSLNRSARDNRSIELQEEIFDLGFKFYGPFCLCALLRHLHCLTKE